MQAIPINFVDSVFEGCTSDEKYRIIHPTLAPGASSFYQHDEQPAGIIFICPCGCKSIRSVPFKVGEVNGWQWDGNREKPTLTPSIQIIGECRWHGFLRQGLWLTC